MPLPLPVTRAEIWKLNVAEDLSTELAGKVMTVQFNPASIDVSYQRPDTGVDGEAGETGAAAYSSMTVELWFDATAAPGAPDVLSLVEPLRQLIEPLNNQPWTQPYVSFAWGKFRFDGTISGISEHFELFSNEGVPLRVKVNLSLASRLAQAHGT